MQTPHQLRTAAADQDRDISITRREQDGKEVIVIDFGRGADAKLDIVGETAIVVAGDEQYEFEVPAEASEVTTNDGMLTIRG